MSGPRKQYPAAFKGKVILAAETMGNCAAGRQFGVMEGSIRGWRKQKEALFSCSGQRRSFRGPKNGVFPEIEKELTAFVQCQRAAHLAVNIELLQAKAREIAREKGIPRSDFKGSKNWVSRYMRRAGFPLRRRTSISQKLPERYEEQLVAFQRLSAVLCSWIADAWASIPEELVSRSFKKCGISNALDGSEDDFLWEDISDKATSGDSASETDDD